MPTHPSVHEQFKVSCHSQFSVLKYPPFLLLHWNPTNLHVVSRKLTVYTVAWESVCMHTRVCGGWGESICFSVEKHWQFCNWKRPRLVKNPQEAYRMTVDITHCGGCLLLVVWEKVESWADLCNLCGMCHQPKLFGHHQWPYFSTLVWPILESRWPKSWLALSDFESTTIQIRIVLLITSYTLIFEYNTA